MRSVKWLPSQLVKRQAISTSLFAQSLPVRSVNVTTAFDPSPPLRQDCDEILSPSTGALSTVNTSAVAGVSGGAVSSGGVPRLVSVGVTVGLNKVAFCAWPITGDAAGADCPSASLEPDSIIQATHPAIAIAGSKTSLAPAFPKMDRLRRAPKPIRGMDSIANGLTLTVIAMPSGRGERSCRTSKKPHGRYTVRLLGRLPLSGSAAPPS